MPAKAVSASRGRSFLIFMKQHDLLVDGTAACLERGHWYLEILHNSLK